MTHSSTHSGYKQHTANVYVQTSVSIYLERERERDGPICYLYGWPILNLRDKEIGSRRGSLIARERERGDCSEIFSLALSGIFWCFYVEIKQRLQQISVSKTSKLSHSCVVFLWCVSKPYYKLVYYNLWSCSCVFSSILSLE